MKPFLRSVRPGFCASLASGLLVLALLGCGRHANSRPASALSEKDRTLLDRYEEVRLALATDDLRATKRAGNAMNAALKTLPGSPGELLTETEGIGTAIALDRARASFEPLSASMVKLAEGVEGYYVFDTPIPAGAGWVQRTAQADNPYTGKAMHDIGTLRK